MIPNLDSLYPGYGLKEYIEATKLDKYPMVSLGCTAQAGNYEELKQLVEMASNSDLGLRPAQERNFRLDGKNSQRAANFIRSLL